MTMINGNDHFIRADRVRATARHEAMRVVTSDMLARTIGESIASMIHESEARLRAEIAELRSAMEEFKFVGVWEQSKQYRAGNFCAHGGIWHANVDTTSRPGTDGTWTLAVARGRDGRDAERRTTPSHRDSGDTVQRRSNL